MNCMPQKIGIILSLLFLVSCNGIVDDHKISIGDNQIISTTIFNEKFGLPFSGNFPVIIKDVEYGSFDLAPKTTIDDFSVSVTVDLSSFNSDVWDGFSPITQLPNGSNFPAWVSINQLIRISIPTFTDSFKVELLFGMDDDRYYFGTALNIQAIDQYYPVGLNISQEIKNKDSKYPYAAIYAYGPIFDENGEKIKNSGIIILSSLKK